ncbi:DNA primase [Nesterenkonia sphaerica]|uniref:DNA primase n=1 Tax=Nesterenkonia sphaerica TaxID=1804988 RepID=A0A5R9AJV9_9MICC|nr:DNA primase [Nesterenkonia sphaerica]TLP78878.1 DNA primase [Nesterenkonia sphaerica]
MAGLIRREDIDAVRERADLREVVEQYVTLKKAGIGSYKGLCPFHDERTPSFHIRPQVGSYHCFGCGESGDVIAFLQAMEHTTFQETVERLAQRHGIELRYEDGGTGPDKVETGRRQRLLDAHKIADEFYQRCLGIPEAQIGRDFLTRRGFTREHAQQYGVGYAPQGWSNLLGHLRTKGFREDELQATGLFSEGRRGLYDRFRGRLMWPIRDMTGSTVGFGGRRLYEDDPGPKYLNSPETTVYKKSQVLYGIEHAKRHIAKQRQLVVVEGYTDVMACHIAGVDTAVATCGTAFGEGHIKIARRLLSDDGSPAEVVFTFDGDEAGQQAAVKAFNEAHQFNAQTFIAVGPDGMDPCDVRQQRGDEAVRAVVASKTPLVEFVIRRRLREWDLNAVEGRLGALRAAAPVVAEIRDDSLRAAYTRELAGWLGTDVNEVQSAVSGALKAQHSGTAQRAGSAQRQGTPQRSVPSAQQAHGGVGGFAFPRPDTRDPAVMMERQALEVILQHPTRLTAEQWEEIFTVRFSAPAHLAVHDGIRIAAAEASDPRTWVESVRQEVPEPLRGFVSELAVTALPARDEEHLDRYCQEILNRLVELQIQHEKANLLGQLQRMDPQESAEAYRRVNAELMELERRRRALRSAD